MQAYLNRKMFKKFFAVFMCIVTLIAEIVMMPGKNVKADAVTTIYFLNTKSWSDLYAYVYMEGNNYVIGGWPGTRLTEAGKLGDNWWKVDVPVDVSAVGFNIIISANGSGSDRVEAYISNSSFTYLTGEGSKLYSSAGAAETDAGISDNPVYKEYNINKSGVGADVPYITYQAEKAKTNALVLAPATDYMSAVQSEASGRSAVKLKDIGDYVEFTLQESANAMVVRYCIPDSADGAGVTASLSLYVDGNHNRDMSLTSAYAWVYGNYPYYNTPSEGRAHRFFDESRLMFGQIYGAGTKIRLQKDGGDNAGYYIIDFIECELVNSPKTKPQNALSITDYGAVANDAGDDYNAITSCINDARSRGREVWIPEGRFINNTTRKIDSRGVTVRGAGMWYSEIYGYGAAFGFSGSSKFYDFSVTGDRTIRRDSEDPAAFGDAGSSSNIVIENIWMEHVKVGVWSGNVDGMVVRGCRIRNTYADGINLCSSTNNSTVENNNIRNTGDDGMAIWPWMGNCSGNVVTRNTVQLPMLANCYAVYGGGNNTFTCNIAEDSVNNGSGFCIGSDYDTSNGYTGETTFSDNLLIRCGSRQTDYNYPVGAIWVWGTKYQINGTYTISNNRIYNSTYEGILVDGYSDISGLVLSDNKIIGCSDGVYVRGNHPVYLTLKDIGVGDFSGNLTKNEATNANINLQGKGVYELDVNEIETESIEINGFQISTTSNGLRCLYTASDTIGESAVTEVGLIYSLADFVEDSDIVITNNSNYVKWFAATKKGKQSFNLGNENTTTYAMTMRFVAFNAAEFNAKMAFRAYAKSADGSICYSDVLRTSISDVARSLYYGLEMPTAEGHDYLYNNIIKVANPGSEMIGWK